MEIKLNAQLRARKEKMAKGLIPAVVYGPETENISLKMNQMEFDKVLSQAGESSLVELAIDGGKTLKVIIKDVDRDPIKDRVTHADFYVVNMKKKITTEIPLHFIGESKAVKQGGGTLEKNMHAIEVNCLPGDLVDHLDVDISALEDFDSAIRMSDIKLPKNMELASHTDEVIALVSEAKVEAAPAPVAAATAPAAAPAAKGGDKAKTDDKAKAGDKGGKKA
jgi:large subunit ribosomal protein L25